MDRYNALSAFLALLVVSLGSTPPANAAGKPEIPGLFAAISWSPRYNRIGTANHEPTLAAAVDKARRDCRWQDCYTVISAQNGCIAIAFSYVDPHGTQWHAWGRGASRVEAEAKALKNCKDHSSQECVLHTSLCTEREVVSEEAKLDVEELLKTYPETSAEAKGIVRMIGIYHPRLLQTEVLLSEKVVERLERHKGLFGTLRRFLTVVEIGAEGFDRLLGYAILKGYVK